jgi:lipoate-protein ligase B
VKLARFREVAPFVSTIEAAVVETLAGFGIVARTRTEHRGVYVGRNAICAIGLAVKQMTTLHGFALNVTTQLDYDQLISPCGTPKFGITSMSHELAGSVDYSEASDALLTRFECRLNASFETVVGI